MSFHRLSCFVSLMSLVLLFGCPSSNPAVEDGPTNKQAAAVDSAANAANIQTRAVAAVLPAVATPVSENQNDESAECPDVVLGSSGGGVSIDLDYGTGCNPPLYPEVSVSGSLTGSISLADASLSFTFDAFTVDDHTLNGTLSMAVESGDETVTFVSNVDLTSDSGNVVGNVEHQIDLRTGVIVVAAGEQTITDSEGMTADVSYSNVAIDPTGNGNFVPESGTATIELPSGGAGSETVTIIVEFLATTPADNIVLVTVGGGEPISYTLGPATSDPRS